MAKSSKFAIGAIIGAVAGIAAGILTAPKSGKETRADIKSKASDIKAEALKKAEAAKSKATSTAEDLVGRTESAIDGAKKGFQTKK
jgi:gas vesicle protein